MRPGQLRVLVDEHDDVGLTRALLAAHDVDRGYVVVHPTPGYSSAMVLAADVLVAMGHNRVLQPYERREALRGPAAATAWARAQQVRHLVVLRAHLLVPAGWQMLIGLAEAAGADVVMVCHVRLAQVRAMTAGVLARIPHQVVTDLTDVLPVHLPDQGPDRRAGLGPGRRRAVRGRPEGAIGWQDTRARAEQLTLAWVDEQMDACDHMIRSQPEPTPASVEYWLRQFDWPRWLIRDRLCAFLAGLVLHSPDRTTTGAALDGARHGFARHGLHLSVPDLGQCAGPGLTTRPVNVPALDRIRAGVTSPRHAAALTLTLITEVWPHLLATLTIDGLAPDAATVTFPPNTPERLRRHRMDPHTVRSSLDPAYRTTPVTFGVPAPARPILQAARHLALLSGAGTTGPLLADHKHPRQDRIDWQVLTRLATVCDVPLPPRLHPLGTTWIDGVRTYLATVDSPPAP